jgi:hypothetical protein
MVTAYNMKLKDASFYKTHLIAESPPPINPYSVDLETVDKIKTNSQYWKSQQWY